MGEYRTKLKSTCVHDMLTQRRRRRGLQMSSYNSMSRVVFGERSGRTTALGDVRVRYCCWSPPRCKLGGYGLHLSFGLANRYARTGPHLQGICSASWLGRTGR
jgi:hypothetical protein